MYAYKRCPISFPQYTALRKMGTKCAVNSKYFSNTGRTLSIRVLQATGSTCTPDSISSKSCSSNNESARATSFKFVFPSHDEEQKRTAQEDASSSSLLRIAVRVQWLVPARAQYHLDAIRLCSSGTNKRSRN